MNITYAITEGLIRLFLFEGRLVLENLRLLPIKMVKYRGELWLESGEVRIEVEKFKNYFIYGN